MLTSFTICHGAIESTLLNILQITNHTVGGEGGQPKPALGESWKSMPHVRLLLERDPISDVCQASIMKHTSIVRLYYILRCANFEVTSHAVYTC